MADTSAPTRDASADVLADRVREINLRAAGGEDELKRKSDDGQRIAELDDENTRLRSELVVVEKLWREAVGKDPEEHRAKLRARVAELENETPQQSFERLGCNCVDCEYHNVDAWASRALEAPE